MFLRKTRTLIKLMVALFATISLPKAQADEIRYNVSLDPVFTQFGGGNLPNYPEDLAYKHNVRVSTKVSQDNGIRGPYSYTTAFREDNNPFTFIFDSGKGYDSALSVSSANYARLDREGNDIGYNRKYKKVVFTDYGSSTVKVLPSPPGTIILPDNQPHWPFLALYAGRPISTSEYTYTVQTTLGLYQYSYANKKWYKVDNAGSQTFSVSDSGYIAGKDSGLKAQATVWYYGKKQHFAGLTGPSKALSVNERGTVVGYANYMGIGPNEYQAWIGKYGSTDTMSIPGMDIPVSINNSGQVIGLQYVSNGQNLATSYEGVLYEQLTGKTVYLKDLFSATGITNVIATALNDKGVIAFYAMKDGQPISGELLPAVRIDNYWVPDNCGIGSGTPYGYIEPFQLHASDESTGQALPLSDYLGFWYVDGDFAHLHSMQDYYGDGTYKMDSVDLWGWNWRTNDTYYVTYVAADLTGKVLNVDTHRIYVHH